MLSDGAGASGVSSSDEVSVRESSVSTVPIIDTTDEREMHTTAPPRRRQAATDVVLLDGTAEAPVVAAEACDAAGAEPRSRRTYGEMYPIMQDTIYSDEECFVEVEVKMTDCGVRFVRYLNGLFQYLVRNPKVMGFILTTVIILLFFKYAQQVVVRAVRAALGAHPGLEPSDDLRSGVVAFTQEMESLMLVVSTLASTFLREGIVGYDPDTMKDTTTSFLSLAASFQESFSANYDTFVLYRMPAAVHWGQVGCQSVSADDGLVGVATVCLTTLQDGTARLFNGSDTEQVLREVPDSFAETVRGSVWPAFTVANASQGVWTSARQLRSIISDRTEYVITYLLPIAFTEHGQTCTAMAGMDVKVAELASAVGNATTANLEIIVVDLQHNLNFLLDTFNTSLHWTDPSYKASQTPVKRVNDIVTPIVHALVPGGEGPPPGDSPGSSASNKAYTLTDGAFYDNGLFYQGLTVMDNWALLASSPLALSVAEAAASYIGSIREYENVLRASTSTYGSGCVTSAEAEDECLFLEAIASIERTFGSKVYSLYVLHTIEAQTTTSTEAQTTSSTEAQTTASTEVAVRARTANQLEQQRTATTWGTTGCTYAADTTERKCFYTNSAGLVTVFSGSERGKSEEVTTLPFSETRRAQFLADHVLPEKSALTRSSGGLWTVPYHVHDFIAGVELTAMSFVLPFEFDSNGDATAVAVFDLSLTWIQPFLNATRHNGTTELVLLDRRGTGIFMGSASRTADTVYGAMSTPEKETINKWTSALYEQSGHSFASSLSFHSGPTLINYRTVSEYWGIVEVMSGEEALQRYLPTPTVTGATDALRLMATGETITLFLYVAGILFAYFLNLVILSCSRLGRREATKRKQQ